MKLRNLSIQNFRGIDKLEIDFTDDLGHVSDLTLIAGPNGSGKTSILDAIWFGLQGAIGYRAQRQAFRTDPEYVVTMGKKYARIDYSIEISEEERSTIESWKQELIKRGAIGDYPGPKETRAEIAWTYPAQIGFDEKGYLYKNKYDWTVLRGKDYFSRLKKLNATRPRGRVGGVYFFEQERRIIANPVGRYKPIEENDDVESSSVSSREDIYSLLVDFAIKDKFGRFSSDESWYNIIRESYNYICTPRKMGEVYTTHSADEYEIEFIDGNGRRYTFDGLSSGERSVLNVVVQYLWGRMRDSIVLIDELELHLHPTWQRRLIENLLRLNDGNQFIVTTHSPALLQAAHPDNVIELGQLDEEIPDWQYLSANEEDQ